MGLFQATEHPSEGPMVAIRPTTLFARTPASIRNPAPKLGQDTDAVLREAGFTQGELQALHAAGVVQGPTPSVPV